MSMLINLVRKIDSDYTQLLSVTPINNVYGIGRSILAFATLITLLFNNENTLFLKSAELNAVGVSPLVNYSIFNLLNEHLALAKYLVISVLLVVISGLYPRLTGILHWYVSFSFYASCAVIDGGDQVNSVLTFLLIPLTLLDRRSSHWSVMPIQSGQTLNSVSWTFVVLLRVQISLIYLHAAIAKLSVTEWINGTAVYYWATHHYHGASTDLKPLVLAILSNPCFVVIITWGTIVLELLLFCSIFLKYDSSRRKLLLLAGLVFHILILIVHGLVSFYFTMMGALILFLSDYTKDYHFIDRKKIYASNADDF